MDRQLQDLHSESLAFDYYGHDITTVKLSRSKHVADYYLGEYEYRGSTNADLKCLKFEQNNANKTMCDNIVSLSEKAKTPYLLAPEMVGYTSDGSLILCYRFDRVGGLHDGLLNKENGILDLPLRTEIRNMLLTIKDMHTKLVFHGKLEDRNSYVSREALTHIVRPKINGEGMSLADIEKHRKQDLQGFKKFLKTYGGGKIMRTSVDWNFFIGLFDYEHMTIQSLINHPVLKDSDEKLEYFRGWYDCCYEKRNHFAEHSKVKQCFNSLINYSYTWKSMLKTSFYKDRVAPNPESHTQKAKYYDNTNPYDLLRYIRNLLKHFDEEDDPIDAIKIERDLSDMFPGIISAMHNACVKAFSPEFRYAFE